MVAQLDKQYVALRPTRAVSRLISYGLFEGRPLTTRGRWINPALKVAGRAIMRLPKMGSVVKPIFILGTGRSGTTILGKTLSLHRDIGYLNEGKLPWHLAYPFEDLNGNYTNQLAHYRLDESSASPAVTMKIHKIYGAYLALTRNHRLLEKYPELIFRIPFVQTIFPDARFIILVRNGNDTVKSIVSWSDQHGQDGDEHTIDWWGKDDRKWHLLAEQLVTQDPELALHSNEIAAFSSHANRAAVEWLLTMKSGLKLVSDQPESALQVKYEDLAGDPSGELKRIMRFCELQDDPYVTDYGQMAIEPRPPRDAVELNSVIEGPFQFMMNRLGY